MSATNEKSNTKPEASDVKLADKRVYERPSLTAFGSVREITQGVGGTKFDGGPRTKA